MMQRKVDQSISIDDIQNLLNFMDSQLEVIKNNMEAFEKQQLKLLRHQAIKRISSKRRLAPIGLALLGISSLLLGIFYVFKKANDIYSKEDISSLDIKRIIKGFSLIIYALVPIAFAKNMWNANNRWIAQQVDALLLETASSSTTIELNKLFSSSPILNEIFNSKLPNHTEASLQQIGITLRESNQAASNACIAFKIPYGECVGKQEVDLNSSSIDSYSKKNIHLFINQWKQKRDSLPRHTHEEYSSKNSLTQAT